MTSGSFSVYSLRPRVKALVEHRLFQRMIISIIVFNAMVLGLETSPAIREEFGMILHVIDMTILMAFVIELSLRIFAGRWQFFRNPWNLFDFIVVGFALLPATEQFSVLRALRVLRVLRLISALPSMRRVVEALLSAIPGILSIASMLLIFYYVFAVIATNLYGHTFPEWFGSLGKSMFSLFQIMTLESWSMGIVRPVLEQHPYAWVFFITYILVATFTMLNLFIAVIVNAMQHSHEDTRTTISTQVESTSHHVEHALLVEIRALRQEIEQLKKQ